MTDNLPKEEIFEKVVNSLLSNNSLSWEKLANGYKCSREKPKQEFVLWNHPVDGVIYRDSIIFTITTADHKWEWEIRDGLFNKEQYNLIRKLYDKSSGNMSRHQ